MPDLSPLICQYACESPIDGAIGLIALNSLAEAFDGRGELVERPEQIGPALDRAFSSDKPSILNVVLEPAAEYFAGRYLGP